MHAVAFEQTVFELHRHSFSFGDGIELCTARENGIYRDRKDKLEKQMENKSKGNYVEIKKIETREQRESRLQKKRESYLNRRKKETEEVKKCRLDKQRESYHIKKKSETNGGKKCQGNSVPHMKTSLCANVQLNRSNFDFNPKSSLRPFFHR